jgi:SAM-dependent methyltransferase
MRASSAVQLPDLPGLEPIDLPIPAAPGRLGVTFRDSKSLPVHRWYPYVEGFSADYLSQHLLKHSRGATVYDPFGGSGTVNLEASKLGIESCFSETNPFMRFVTETKINARFEARRSGIFVAAIQSYRRAVLSARFARSTQAISLDTYEEAFRNRDFFVENDLRQLLAAKDLAIEVCGDTQYVRDLILLALASIVVQSSNMTRRADLRRRREGEYTGRKVDVRQFILQKLSQIEHDVLASGDSFAPARFLNEDSRDFDAESEGQFSLILTSPPYVNGTNYIRNTKLELWFLDFIGSEKELSQFNKKSITCGINNVIKSRRPSNHFDFVEAIARKLDDASLDDRIPSLVRGYCSDMMDVLQNCRRYLRRDGRLVLDIGDSQFYGVHIPTDFFIEKIASNLGFELEKRVTLARRHSRDKSPLQQVELTFRVPFSSASSGPR